MVCCRAQSDLPKTFLNYPQITKLLWPPNTHAGCVSVCVCVCACLPRMFWGKPTTLAVPPLPTNHPKHRTCNHLVGSCKSRGGGVTRATPGLIFRQDFKTLRDLYIFAALCMGSKNTPPPGRAWFVWDFIFGGHRRTQLVTTGNSAA